MEISHNQLTLPDELRRVLGAVQQDEIDVGVVENDILLKPSPAARRRRGGRPRAAFTGATS